MPYMLGLKHMPTSRLFTAFMVLSVAMLLVGSVLPAGLAAVDMALTAAFEAPALSVALLALAALGIYSTLGTFWTIPTAFMSGTAAAAAIAFITAVGNLGGFVGPYAVGYLRNPFKTITSGS